MIESDILREIQTKVSGPDIRLFRMQSLRVQTIDGTFINFGIKGMSDLVGLRSVVVTPDMVGKRIAMYTAIEVKSATGRVSAEQDRFIAMVRGLGGMAGVARGVEEARQIITTEPSSASE